MSSPWQSRSEFLVDQALENALAQSPDELRKMRPVALPQQLHPKRTGLRQSPATVEQVLNIDRYTPTYRSWVSGMPVQSSIMSDRSWSGSARNSMSEGVW